MTVSVSDMFCGFYRVKTHKNANNSTTTKAREKISTYLEFIEFGNLIEESQNCNNSTTTKAGEKNNHRFGIHRQVNLTKFKNHQILQNKIGQTFLLTTKPYIY